MAKISNHQSKTDKAHRDTTQTPPWLYAAFNSLYQYDIDLAALPQSAHHIKYFTPEDDALIKDWRGELSHIRKPVGWLNPPFSNILPWREKCLIEQEKGFFTTMFVPHDNRAEWWFAGLPVRVIDIVGYYDIHTYLSGNNSRKGTEYKKWRSGGIRFVDSKTGLENETELNKPMCLVEFSPHHIGKPTDYTTMAKDILLEIGHAELEKIKNSKVA